MSVVVGAKQTTQWREETNKAEGFKKKSRKVGQELRSPLLDNNNLSESDDVSGEKYKRLLAIGNCNEFRSIV